MALQKLTAELYQLFESEKYDQCQKLLPPIKIELIKHNLFVPNPNFGNDVDHLNDLKVAQRILEIGLLLLLLTDNYQSFEHYVAQLKPFYNYGKLHPKREVNTDTTKIISLYLVYLLSQGLISNFHLELEVLYNSSKFDVDRDHYLQFPISLEKNLMEGNYIKIWKLLGDERNLPCKEYKLFIATLINALRFEIAKSLDKTYDSIPISNCKNLLFFPQEMAESTVEDILKNELNVTNCTFSNGRVVFNNDDLNSVSDTASKSGIIENLLNYAEQMESIV